MSTYPAPIIATISDSWEGIDGPWSTFDLGVGTPSQNIRVLVSLAGQQTWVLLSQACNTTAGCPDSRGATFNPDNSTSWHNQGIYTLNDEINNLLGSETRGQFGFDRINLRWVEDNGALNDTVVAGFISSTPWIGQLGVSPRATNFSELGNAKPSYFRLLKNNNLIPSLAYSYQQGSYYRSSSFKNTYASLIFGGYDTSRLVPNNVTFAFAPDDGRELVVGIQSVIKSPRGTSNNDTQLLTTGLLAALDSTQPHLWLPKSVCQQFEQAFGLSLDNVTGLYLVNDSHHQSLLNENAKIVFKLGNAVAGGDVVSITTSYGSLALRGKPPLVSNESWYFPLKIAANSSQYTLGRAFMQETYMTADYDRQTFNLSQANWDDSAPTNVKIILPPSAVQTAQSSSGGGGISMGAIVGILIACVAGLFLAAGTYLVMRRRRRHDSTTEADGDADPDAEGHNEMSAEPKASGLDVKGEELDGSTVEKHELGHDAVPPVELEGRKLHELSGETEPAELGGDNRLAAAAHELHGDHLHRPS